MTSESLSRARVGKIASVVVGLSIGFVGGHIGATGMLRYVSDAHLDDKTKVSQIEESSSVLGELVVGVAAIVAGSWIASKPFSQKISN